MSQREVRTNPSAVGKTMGSSRDQGPGAKRVGTDDGRDVPPE